MLAYPALGCPRNAVEQQRAVGCQGRDSDFDQARIANIFGRDDKAIRESTTHQVGAHSPGGERPVGGTLTIVLFRQDCQLLRELLLCMLAQNGVDGWNVTFGGSGCCRLFLCSIRCHCYIISSKMRFRVRTSSIKVSSSCRQ